MIEREFVKQKKREFQVQEFISNSLRNVGHSHTKMQKTPLGEKIIVHASRPGLIVGREGQNIKKLTSDLKKKFKLENPQIEINEVENINLDATIVAERIASSLERFGISKFKGVGHKTMADSMNSGALGIEILVSGKVPSSRAKTWRFYQGYLKKCGDIAVSGVDTAYATAYIKTGVIGIQVRIMPPDTKLPDKIEISDEIQEVVEEIDEKKEDKAEQEKKEKKKDSGSKDKQKVSEAETKKPVKEKAAESKEKETGKEEKADKKTDKETKTEEPASEKEEAGKDTEKPEANQAEDKEDLPKAEKAKEETEKIEAEKEE